MGTRIQNVSPKEYCGRVYRSTLEADTAKTLDAIGLPFKYEDRKILLLEGFRSDFQKDKVRSITYTPDFEIGPLMLECKGFETPEWKIKKKLLFKYLKENEPDTIFYQIKDNRGQLIKTLDRHWVQLGYCIHVQSTKKKNNIDKVYDSIEEAFYDLGLHNKSMTAVLKCMMGKVDNSYGYIWKLKQITI